MSPCSEAQVLLRWALQKGYPILPKSTKPARLAANLAVQLQHAAMPMPVGISWPASLPPSLARHPPCSSEGPLAPAASRDGFAWLLVTVSFLFSRAQAAH